MKTLYLLFLAFCFGCNAPVFSVVLLEAPAQTTAPTVDTLEVTVSAIVDGTPTEKVVLFEGLNQTLPLTFFLEFEGQRRLDISLELVGSRNGVQVLRAQGTGVVGKEITLTALFCGDAVIQTETGETCDDGPLNSDTDPSACRLLCLLPGCGDGILDADEACDDGNQIDADGCEADCSLPACQNGIVDPGEVCLFPGEALAVDAGAVALVAADLNNDGFVDLATANDGNIDSVNVLLNQGLALFDPRTVIGLPANSDPSDLVASDLNGDGDIDVALTASTPDQVLLIEQRNGLFSLNNLPPLAVGGTPNSLAVGDVTGDGRPDIVTANLGNLNSAGEFFGGGLSLLKNTDGVSFSSAATLGNNTTAHTDIVLAPLNEEDTLLDVASSVALGFSQPLVEGFLNNGSLVTPFTGNPFSNFLVQSNPQDFLSLAAGDIDGDGFQDLLVGHSFGVEFGVLFGKGDGTFLPEELFFVGEEQSDVTTGDLNQDGLLDIIVAGDANIHFFLGQTERNLVVGTLTAGSGALVVADLNGDEALDLAVTSFGGIQLFLSNP
jgi:cysteine-rich repeat protein